MCRPVQLLDSNSQWGQLCDAGVFAVFVVCPLPFVPWHRSLCSVPAVKIISPSLKCYISREAESTTWLWSSLSWNSAPLCHTLSAVKIKVSRWTPPGSWTRGKTTGMMDENKAGTWTRMRSLLGCLLVDTVKYLVCFEVLDLGLWKTRQ